VLFFLLSLFPLPSFPLVVPDPSFSLTSRYKASVRDEKRDQVMESRELDYLESKRKCRESTAHPATTREIRNSFSASVGTRPSATTRSFKGTAPLYGTTAIMDATRGSTTRDPVDPLSQPAGSVSATRPRDYERTFRYRSPSAPRRG
jgi:hypothetical protein